MFDEDSQRWSIDRSAELELPESVREVIERRVERLGGDARGVLRLAAVIGRHSTWTCWRPRARLMRRACWII